MSKKRVGYKCKSCGTTNPFSSYVYLHWTIGVIHRCGCGVLHVVNRGKAKPLGGKKKPEGVRIVQSPE